MVVQTFNFHQTFPLAVSVLWDSRAIHLQQHISLVAINQQHVTARGSLL